MDSLALSVSRGRSVARRDFFTGLKINQRIARPDLSESVNPSRMGEAEQELVLRSQAGDPAAFETLVRQ
ncbi:MAG TPA: hypothetical protein VF607_16340, partial [Verrucomicrobiae bacterium]